MSTISPLPAQSAPAAPAPSPAEPDSPSPTASLPPSAPSPLSDSDLLLLAHFHDSTASTLFLLEEHNLSYSRLAAWLRQPKIKRALADIRFIARRRARALLAENASSAAHSLSLIASGLSTSSKQPDPKSVRLAAATLLRHLSPPRATTTKSSHSYTQAELESFIATLESSPEGDLPTTSIYRSLNIRRSLRTEHPTAPLADPETPAHLDS
jgi:hypothetical protein